MLVTGGTGFVGSHVVDRLVDGGAAEVVVFDKRIVEQNVEGARERGNVTLVEGDVTDPDAVRAAVSGVDGVFHLAVLPLGPCIADPRACLSINVVGTFNVVEAAADAGVRKVVYSSASSVYGDTEATMDEGHPLDTRTMYGASKLAGEYLLHAFAHRLEYVILRYMNVYGPRQAGGLVIAVLDRLLAGDQPVIQGDGSASFDFVHVADVARANVLAMSSDVSGEAFNVGSGEERTVREVTERLIAITEAQVEPRYDREAEVLMKRRVGSSEKAARLIGFRAAVPLDEGLASVVEWRRQPTSTPSGRA
jgi:UDP-glucose 4-epimerase